MIRAVPRLCWLSARKVILKLDDYAEATYVEGWAFACHGMVIEHGWVVRDGLIVDPTLPDSRLDRRVLPRPGVLWPGPDRGVLGLPEGSGSRANPLLARLRIRGS